MRVTYDATVDALAIELVPGAKSARTREVDRFTRVDWDADGRLILIEVLEAGRVYGPDVLASFEPAGELLGLAEAAAESGLTRDTLRQLIHQERLPGVKRGRDWSVQRSDLYNYLERRQPRGRPAKNLKAQRNRPSRRAKKV